ncbi:MAG: hypothetical protein ACRCZO_03210 [Cetobacterium sp.]
MLTQETSGVTTWETLAQFLTRAKSVPESVERVWFSRRVLRKFVDDDGTRISIVHELPRNPDPIKGGVMKFYFEITLIRNRRNMFDVYIEQDTTSDKIGVFLMKCSADRLPILGDFTRGNFYYSSGEGVVETIIDMNCTENFLPQEPIHQERPIVDMVNLITQGSQNEQDEIEEKQDEEEKKNHESGEGKDGSEGQRNA